MAYYARRGGDRVSGGGRVQGGGGGGGGGGRGGYVLRGRSGMPPRGPLGLGVNSRPSARTIAKSFSRTKDMTWRPDLFSDSMAASGIETGTKLYISNLDYGVSNEDIKELFSEVGHLKRFAVHFDGYGRPNGTAEVVFTRRSDAIAALKRYNNVLLDGKAMKIEVIGSDLGLPMTPRINVVGASNGRPTRTVVMTNRYNRGAFQAGRGRGRGRGRAPFQSQFQGRGTGSVRGRGQFQGRGRGRRQAGKTADELDKDLETYHAEAMKTD
ncbi:THO complex subunit 4D isoform X2 [Oryza sativa Japonica Group]|nr:THO complex subunit 4D isoform X2 [Oryza sativa Japonica Group]XP_052165365.1 THO complex subunit 4D-like isoform X2 [Oryza glaberrima]